MKKTIFYSHGNKGGCGKSFLAMLVTNYLLKKGPVVVVETDPKQWDVLERYKDDPDVTAGSMSLNRAGDAANAITNFGNFLEESNASQIVINLPGGAGETVDAHAHVLRSLADGLGYRMVVTYSMENDHVATKVFKEDLKSGLLSVVDPVNRFAVYPLFKKDAREFPWFSDPERKEGKIGEIVIPALLSDSALNRVKGMQGRFTDMAEGKTEGLRMTEMLLVRKWLDDCFSELDKVFGEEE
jgi:hypothetical protein